MKKLERILSLVLSLIFILPLTANAVTFGYYGQLDAGLGLTQFGKNQTIPWEKPNDSHFNSFNGNNKLETSFFFGMQIGIAAKINPKTILELGLELNQNINDHSATGKIYAGDDSLNNHWYDYEYKAKLFRGMAIGRAFYEIVPKISPFVAIGAGLGRITVKDWKTTPVSSKIDPYDRTFVGHTTNNFAWQLGGGVGFQITKNTQAILGYRYVNFGSTELVDAHSAKKLKTGIIDINEIYIAIHFLD